MERIRSLAMVSVVVAIGFSGCLGGGQGKALLPSVQTIAPGITNVSGEIVFDHGSWEIGDYWQTHLGMNLGGDFIIDQDGAIVVTGNGTQYELGTNNAVYGVIDSYFDDFYQGPVTLDLNPVVYGETIRMFDWPLKAGKTWTTRWMPGNVFDFELTNATLTVEVFEDDLPGAPPRLRILGESEDGMSIDYDYSPTTGWINYFRMTNITTGRLAIALDVKQVGKDFSEEIHRLTPETLYIAFKMVPPFDPVTLTPKPESFEVPEGFAFIQYVRFVIVYTLEGPAGAGVAGATIVAPDGSQDTTQTPGALEEKVAFELNHFEPYRSGMYAVSYELAGTAAAFVLVTGFKDSLVRL